MKRIKTSCLVAAWLGVVACGDTAASGTNDTGGGTSGNATGATAGTPNGGQNNTSIKPGDLVDLDGDGAKDDGVAVDENMDGIADGVDTNGDGKADKPLPGATGGTNGGGTNGTTNTGGSSSTDDASTEPGLMCDGVGVCDDNFMDTCDADPDKCPATQTASIDVPEWDCSGNPPSNVYAYAKFPDGTTVPGANLAPGACVAFFEGAKDLFYVKWFGIGPKTSEASCTEYDGCVCPQAAGNNWDRRLYAFTWNGDANCEDIVLIDHDMNAAGGNNNAQAVSNECRKYLYAMHGDGDPNPIIAWDGKPAFDLPFSYVAGSLAEAKRRLKDFPKIEVTCVEVMGPGVPKAQLMVQDVQINTNFVAEK